MKAKTSASNVSVTGISYWIFRMGHDIIITNTRPGSHIHASRPSPSSLDVSLLLLGSDSLVY